MNIAQGLLLAFAGHQAVAAGSEMAERKRLFAEAHGLAAERGKPVLVVGRPVHVALEYPCATDVTLDLNPAVLETCPVGGVVADVRSIPYRDKHFGAVLVSHVLEHMADLEDAQLAWAELWRVSDTVLVAYPRKGFIRNWVHGDHHLWTYPQEDGTLLVEERHLPARRALIYPNGEALVWSR